MKGSEISESRKLADCFFTRMQDWYQEYRLKNGIRVVHKQISHSRVGHCGFVLNIGSRDEKESQWGLAHFWEHMAFKGTQKRKAYHILNRLESLGGELNAFTEKEKISFYASFLVEHYEKAIELLTDITFDSIFPQTQIERERHVILEEMAMYQDTPDDALLDEFDALVFSGHPLGHNILGTTESVQSFKREDFNRFIQGNINTDEIVFSSVGNLPFEKVIRLAEKYMQALPAKQAKKKREPFTGYTAREVVKDRHNSQAYCVLGRPAYSIFDSRKLAFLLLNNLLGGPGLNSRLNMALREKLGYVYAVEANFHPYTDTGLFSVSFATEARYLEKSRQIIYKEFKNLREKPLGIRQLRHAKEQLIGQLAIAEESNLSFMLMMGKSLLDMGKVDPLPHVLEAIRKLSADMVQEVAQEMLDEAGLSCLIYLPEE